MLFRSLRASVMRSSGRIVELGPETPAARRRGRPSCRGCARRRCAERLVGSKLSPLRMTSSAVALGISAVLDAGEGLGVEHRQAAGRALRPSGCMRLRAGRSTARAEQLRRELAVERRLGAAVHRPFEFHLAQHHLGMAGEIFVDRDRAVRAVDGRKVAAMPRPRAARRARACAGTECRS